MMVTIFQNILDFESILIFFFWNDYVSVKSRDYNGKNDYVILTGKSNHVETKVSDRTGKTDYVPYIIVFATGSESGFAAVSHHDWLGKTDYVWRMSGTQHRTVNRSVALLPGSAL